jgi:hypothetical protein
VAAVAPIIGPAILAAIPARSQEVYQAPEPAPAEVAPAAADQKVAGPSGMGLAAHGTPGGAAANPAYAQVYNRSNTTFDRRFFETKFTGFFRVMPSDAEKDMVIVVKAAKAEYIARRISRISMQEMHMQLQRGGTEVSVPFSEMVEVSVRHKDAK